MEFSGERYLPEMDIDSEISIFHRQRYESILHICKGKKVLDAACGEGYGSNYIAEAAEHVIGIDISPEAIKNAKEKYQRENLEYKEASVEKIPVEDGWADVIVSYETIEHVSEEIQEKFLKEIKRILKKDGILIMSSPDKKNYSDIPKFQNEFHVHELYFDEFDKLIGRYFLYKKYYYQGMSCNSYIFDKKQGIVGREKKIVLREADDTRAEYLIVIASGKKLKEDISSVIYDSSNLYYLLKDEVLRLKERLGEPGKIIEQKENYICEQREKLKEIEDSLREANGIVEQKENYICEQREKLKEIEDSLREANGIVEQKENYICEQREKLKEIEDSLREANGIAEQKENYICEQREKLKEIEDSLREANGVVEQKENYICEQGEKLKEIEDSLREANGIVEQKENYICEQREKLKEIEDSLREANGVVEQKENYICRQREKIAELEDNLKEINSIVKQKENFIYEQTVKLEKSQSYGREQEEKIKQINNRVEQMEKEMKRKQDDFMTAMEEVKEELEKTKVELNISMLQKEKLKKEKKYLVVGVVVLGITCIITTFISLNQTKNTNSALTNETVLSSDREINKSENEISSFDVTYNWQERNIKSTEILKGSYEIETLSDGSKFAWLESNASIKLKNTPNTSQIEIKGFMPMDIHKKANVDSVELKVWIDGKEVQSFQYTEDTEVSIVLEKASILENPEEDDITIEFQTSSQINQFERGLADDNRNLSWRINSIYLK